MHTRVKYSVEYYAALLSRSADSLRLIGQNNLHRKVKDPSYQNVEFFPHKWQGAELGSRHNCRDNLTTNSRLSNQRLILYSVQYSSGEIFPSFQGIYFSRVKHSFFPG